MIRSRGTVKQAGMTGRSGSRSGSGTGGRFGNSPMVIEIKEYLVLEE